MLDRSETRRRESLEEIAALTLDFGRLLMEAGGSGHGVEEITAQVAFGLGAERLDPRVGFASLAVTIGIGPDATTRMRKVGPLGANQNLHHALFAPAARIERGALTVGEAREELDRIVRASPCHPDWVVALAVGVACAAFGRLLGVDWTGVGPIFGSAVLGQLVRRRLALHHVNVFISVTAVAFLASILCGLGSRWTGSHTVAVNMIAAVLLLVPGVPLFNAQYDILEGYPTLGCARGVWAAMILVFVTLGVWFALGVMGEGR